MNNPQIQIADLCKTHQVLLVRQTGYGPQDPWQALLISTQISLFQGATADNKVHAQIGGDITRIGELGCLACRKPDLFGTLIDTVQKAKRAEHIGAIKALGERWATEGAKKP